MNALTPAEKQKAYRRRIAARKLAADLFNGHEYITVQEFREALHYDEAGFYRALEGLGEETQDYKDDRNRVYEDAFSEAYEREFQAAYEKAIQDGRITEDDEDLDEIEAEAEDLAEEAAKEEVREWESGINTNDYADTCLEYHVADLLDAHREACGV